MAKCVVCSGTGVCALCKCSLSKMGFCAACQWASARVAGVQDEDPRDLGVGRVTVHRASFGLSRSWISHRVRPQC